MLSGTLFLQEKYIRVLFSNVKIYLVVHINGPAVVHQLDSTTVIPPDSVANVDKFENIVINIQGQDRG